jgi:hypothetical protein
MDTLGDPLTTRPIQMGCEICIEPYPNWQCWCGDIPDCQFGNRLVLIRTQTRSDGLEPFLAVGMPRLHNSYTGWDTKRMTCTRSTDPECYWWGSIPVSMADCLVTKRESSARWLARKHDVKCASANLWSFLNGKIRTSSDRLASSDWCRIVPTKSGICFRTD